MNNYCRSLLLLFAGFLSWPLSSVVAQRRPSVRDDYVALYQQFIDQTPGTYRYEAHYTGDLNGDKRADAVVVALNDTTTSDGIPDGFARRVLLLIRQRNGQLKLAAINDDLIDCTTCGGAGVGDPHQGVTIKGRYVSFESLYGANQRTQQVITFRYEPAENHWLLYKIGLLDYTSSTGAVKPVRTKTAREFGRVRFRDFTTNLIYGNK